MKALFVSLIFFAQFSMAARIVNASWEPQTQSVVVNLVYRGSCLAHNFTVEWQPCAVDSATQKVTRLGLILDSGWQDTCTSADEYQTITSAEPADGCPTEQIYLKATSSKIPVLVEK